MNKLLFALDRTAVLFIGIVVGAVIGISFFSGGSSVPGGEGQPKPVLQPPTPVAASPSSQTNSTVADSLAPRLAAAVREGRKIQIGVFGDSFGDGVWAGVYNILRGDSRYEIRQFSERSTGFTRYRSLNLLDDARAKLDRNPVDIAIISYGANDTQGIYLDGRGHQFMTEGWQRIVTERVTAIVNLMRERGIQVYWVGLPKMREAQFDTDIRAMNAFFTSRMQALGVPYVETATLTTGATASSPPISPIRAITSASTPRTNDGVHMTIPGYVLVMRPLTDRIRRSVAAAGGPPVLAPAAERQAGRAETPKADRPRERTRDAATTSTATEMGGTGAIGSARCPRASPARPGPTADAGLLGAAAALAAVQAPASAGCIQNLCNSEAIAPFLAKLRAARPNAGAPVHIIQIGDSHTAGDSITQGWRSRLQARHGAGGRGLLAAGRPYRAT